MDLSRADMCEVMIRRRLLRATLPLLFAALAMLIASRPGVVPTLTPVDALGATELTLHQLQDASHGPGRGKVDTAGLQSLQRQFDAGQAWPGVWPAALWPVSAPVAVIGAVKRSVAAIDCLAAIAALNSRPRGPPAAIPAMRA
jgi:hypothetical protein